jgi:hypothetical protein
MAMKTRTTRPKFTRFQTSQHCKEEFYLTWRRTCLHLWPPGAPGDRSGSVKGGACSFGKTRSMTAPSR